MTSPNPHCRIGKITRKGGATVRVLRPERDGSTGESLALFRKDCEEIHGYFTDSCAGYGIVMWDRNGDYSRAFRIARSSPLGRRLMRAVIGEVFRADTMADVVQGVLNGDRNP